MYHIQNVSCSTRTGEQIVQSHEELLCSVCFSRPKGTTVLNVLAIYCEFILYQRAVVLYRKTVLYIVEIACLSAMSVED